MLAILAAVATAMANRQPGAGLLLYLREDANWHNRDHSISVTGRGRYGAL